MLKEQEKNIDEIKAVLSKRGIDYHAGVAYIIPESCSDEIDIINEHSPDLKKDLTAYGITSVVVRGENHRYLSLRSADIILPLIYGIPFAIFANFITDWIKNNLNEGKIIKIRYIKEDGDKYKEITIEGDKNEVSKILDKLRDH